MESKLAVEEAEKDQKQAQKRLEASQRRVTAISQEKKDLEAKKTLNSKALIALNRIENSVRVSKLVKKIV
jgi:hypothetical protein